MSRRDTKRHKYNTIRYDSLARSHLMALYRLQDVYGIKLVNKMRTVMWKGLKKQSWPI